MSKFDIAEQLARQKAELEEENFRLRAGLGVPMQVEVKVTRVGYKPTGKVAPRLGRMHLVIPDCQVKDGVDTSHLGWIGQYIVDKKPDVVVCIGDFADMPSLSSYDRGKKSFEGRRYKTDIEAAVRGMAQLLAPLDEYNEVQRKARKPLYHPRKVLTLGNHEERIVRAVEDDARLEGTIGLADLQYEKFGWEVIPYLKPIEIHGLHYSHYFVSGVMGRPVASAASLLAKGHVSAIMGHVQTTDCCFRTRSDGQQIVGIFAGTCYLHDEDYLSPVSNQCRRQIVVLNEVDGNGGADPMFVSLDYLKARYAK